MATLVLLGNGNIWKAGKLYVPVSSVKKGAKTFGDFVFKKRKYVTLDSKRRVKGIAPRNLI